MADLVEHLGINWKLLLASIVNFFLLFFILRRYAYRPILGMLEKREKTIADSVRQSQEIEQAVRQLEQRKAEELRATRQEALQLVEEAGKRAETVRAEAVAAAKAEAQQLIAKTRAELQAERAQLVHAVREDLADLVTAATEKVLREKLNAAADRKLVEQSLNQMERRRV